MTRYFLDEEEWKMTRFLRPLANKKLIISERCGNKDELMHWNDAVVFVDSFEEMLF
ncbi:unnamed protein product, partial [Heterosigma akashiwo]